MNIFHQLKTGGDPKFRDIYEEVPWAEFMCYPGQKEEELLEKWEKMPKDVPRAFKTHASPGDFCTLRPNCKYVVVVRNPEEAMVSFKPFLEQHNPKLWELWGADKTVKPTMVNEKMKFEQWFFDIALKWKP